MQGASAKIDLVELTGDLFMLANTYHLDTFIDYFEKKAEEYGFLYAPIWGTIRVCSIRTLWQNAL